MKREYLPSEINEACRMLMGIEDLPSDVLDNPERFDSVFGAGRHAETSRNVLNILRRGLECPVYSPAERAAKIAELKAQAKYNHLKRQSFGGKLFDRLFSHLRPRKA